jgi:hypothetical protein
MLRAVQEFFSANGRCREIRLADGPPYPVLLSIEQMLRGVELLGEAATHAPALRIGYRGHKEDLIALGCICRGRLAAMRYGRTEEDPRGALIHVERKSAPGRRGMIELSYITRSRAFAGTLPGMRAYCADWLEICTAPPVLRLVIDNTRRQPSHLQRASSGRSRERQANN